MAIKTENTTVSAIDRLPPDGLLGRRKILSPVREITVDNVVDVLSKALSVHQTNQREITYLYDVYRGKQDIRLKEKYQRVNINNKVIINRANEIVTFKSAYLLTPGIQYVSASGGEEIPEEIVKLNGFMRDEDKESKDKEITDWFHICGVAERLTLTDEMAGIDGGAPYYVHTLDPREAFCIYNAGVGQRKMAGVVIQTDEDEENIYTVYTKDTCFYIKNNQVVEVNSHALGEIPLVEYVNNMARMGAFEVVLSILNSINDLESNAIDAIQDFVNGFDVFQDCEISGDDYRNLSLGGQAVMISGSSQARDPKVYRIATELQQSGVQQRVDSLTDDYLEICGMPNRNGGSSTSDTGAATIFRDGWFAAEGRAADTEKLFKRSEREFLRIVLNICNAKQKIVDLELKDIEIDFGRKNLNNLQSKFQCMCEGLANDKIHPQSVYEAFGDIFGDKTIAYQKGMEWYEKSKAEQEASLQADLDRERSRVTQSETDETEAQAVT